MNAWTYMRLIPVLAVAAAATACTSSVPERAGGNINPTVTVLTLANGYGGGPPAQLMEWIKQVHEQSDGSIRIDTKDSWRRGERDFEARTFEDVKQSQVDAAWVGARIMDRVGVSSFQALLAPMLVDSYDLEAKVFQAGIPAQMLAAVSASGVVGVGILPGPMRKVMGIAKPFLTTADFAGARIAYQDSALTQATLTALGATAVPVPGGAKLDGIDGYEQQLESIAGNHYDTTAKYTTANLNLWPRPLLIIMGTAAWAKLSAAQRDVLSNAAGAAMQPAIEASRREDLEALHVLCASAMTMPTALPEQLADLGPAVQPVYAALRRDSNTNGWLDQIQALKNQLKADPETVSCAGVNGASQPASPIDGTYTRPSDPADFLTACHGEIPPDAGIPPADSTLEIVFDHGGLTLYEQPPGGVKEIGWRGTYQVYRDTLEITESGTTQPSTVTWSLNGATLTLSDLRNGRCDGEAAWTARPWTRRT